MKSAQFKIALIGEVDAGKSTTLGQILIQTGSVLPSKMLDALKASQAQNKDFEPAFLLDAFEYERTNEMTVDITTTRCLLRNTSIQFLDTPGHQHLSSKFIGGAANVDLAILILDAQNQPDKSQFRHLEMLRKIGLHRFGVLINKLNPDSTQAHFENYLKSAQEWLAPLKKEIQYLAPVDSKKGLGFEKRDYNWFSGPCLFDFLQAEADLNISPSNLFCTFKQVLEKDYWLSSPHGKINSTQPLFFGDKKINVQSISGGLFQKSVGPWISRGHLDTLDKAQLPQSGFISDSPNDSCFTTKLCSDLITFEDLQPGSYLYRNFWTSMECTLLKINGADGAIQLNFENSVQLNLKNNRYNLFSLEKQGKIVAIGLPQP